MALTQAQRTLLEKARSSGAGNMGIALSDEACHFLFAVIARDLGLLDQFPEFPEPPEFFSLAPSGGVLKAEGSVYDLFDRLIQHEPNADTYFSCLASLHRARLKYSKILSAQPIPTMDQVGPRSLLQYGNLGAKALAGFLLWRKWIFDIDNRAGQETGYLFEPIVAHAIGGAPFSATKSPVKRVSDPKKGRQVDCIRDKKAYEIKIRVTIAASGQGRWGEEKEFPQDCRKSGYTPVLIVFDPTPNPKLDELARAFQAARGEVYIGATAWAHLEAIAGPAMASFLEKYVRTPIQEILQVAPTGLPTITFGMDDTCFTIETEGEEYRHPREEPVVADEDSPLPDDVDDESPGL